MFNQDYGTSVLNKTTVCVIQSMSCLQTHRCETIGAIDGEAKRENHSPNNWLLGDFCLDY